MLCVSAPFWEMSAQFWEMSRRADEFSSDHFQQYKNRNHVRAETKLEQKKVVENLMLQNPWLVKTEV